MGDGWFAFGMYEDMVADLETELERVGVVVVGPIEFASDGPRDDKGPTEFGGLAGLIQEGPAGEHLASLTGAEKRGLMVRAVPVMAVDPLTGLEKVDETANAVDPQTGLIVDPAWNEDGATTAPVEAPPRTGDPKSGTL